MNEFVDITTRAHAREGIQMSPLKKAMLSHYGRC